MPPIPSKPRHSARLDREPINKGLGLSFPLEEFKQSEAPRNHEVLERLFFILSAPGESQKSVEDAAKSVVGEILSCWRGSNVEKAHELTLIKKVKALHSLYKYEEKPYIMDWFIIPFHYSFLNSL